MPHRPAHRPARRYSLRALAALSAWTALAAARPGAAVAAAAAGTAAEGAVPAPAAQLVAMAWRRGAAPAEDSDPTAHRIGTLRLDWAQRRNAWNRVVPTPSRAHGLTPDGQGGFYAVAARPGTWLVHVPADNTQEPQWLDTARDEASVRTLNGHLLLTRDGRWLYSTETAREGGTSWLVRRDARTLRELAAWPLPGVDAHQMLWGADETQVLVALGGIPRDARGRRLANGRLAPALLRVDTRTGALQGQWTLPDPRWSVRHMAWSQGGDRRLLGIALQGQHDERTDRRNAPLLALWDGERLAIPPAPAMGHDGYAGDVCAGPGGSFLLSAQRSGQALLWHPDAPDEFIRIGELTDICAVDHWADAGGLGMLMGAGRGVARWQAGQAQMLPWPELMAPDNHLALLA